MSPRFLLRLYPRAWRERYAEEFLALIGDRRLSVPEAADVCLAAVGEWTRHSRESAPVVAAGVSLAADATGRVLRATLPRPEVALTAISVALTIVAVGYLLYRGNEWLFERTPVLGQRAFRAGVLLAFVGGVVQVWGRSSTHPGVLHVLPLIGNSAFFWTWLLCTAQRREVTA